MTRRMTSCKEVYLTKDPNNYLRHNIHSRGLVEPSFVHHEQEDHLNFDKENDKREKLCKTKVTPNPCNAFRKHARASLVVLKGKNLKKVLLCMDEMHQPQSYQTFFWVPIF